LKRFFINQLSYEYCWNRLLRKDPQWPKEIDLIHILKTKQVHDYISRSAGEDYEHSPGGYISVLAYIYIMKELEKEAAECTDRLYSLFPNPDCKWKHIVLNVKALVSSPRQKPTDT
jgi:hypothetical protein